MDASLYPLTQGAIVRYIPNYDQQTIANNRTLLLAHPVMILNYQLAEPKMSYQCFVLTSRYSGYFGNKIFLNTKDAIYRGWSVINTTAIETIPRQFLYEVLGFAPPSLVKKCLHDYAWEIGLSDEIPDYYQNNETAMGFIQCGECNDPDDPNGYSRSDMENKLTCARASRTFHATPNSIINNSYRIPDTRDLIQPPPFPISSNNTTILSTPVPELSEEEETTEDAVEEVDATIVSEPEPPVKPKEKPKPVQKNAISEKNARAICAREPKHIVLNSRTIGIIDHISPEDQYLIWSSQITRRAIAAKYGIKCDHSSRRIFDYIIEHIELDKADLIDLINEKKIELRFLHTKYHVAFQCFTPADCAKINLTLPMYSKYAQGLKIQRTFISDAGTSLG